MLKYLEKDGIVDSFSRNHTIPYSAIGLQQLNLLYRYPDVYSHTAGLLVNSSSAEEDTGSSINYGKVGVAIIEAINTGANMSLPDVNTANVGFKPDRFSNSIICGLKGINSVNDEQSRQIIANRPYNSFDDFLLKNPFPKKTIINLVKSGAFDTIESKMTRQELMKHYFLLCVSSAKTEKTKLTMANVSSINDIGLLTEENKYILRYYNFNKYISLPEFKHEKIGNKQWLLASDTVASSNGLLPAKTFFEQQFIEYLVEDKDYRYTKDGIVFCKTPYNKVYKQKIDALVAEFNTPEFIQKYNETLYSSLIKELWDKYCVGTTADWEFDSLSFYHSEHPLAHIDEKQYSVSSYADIPKQPIQEEEYQYKGQTLYKNRLFRIAGTILDTDKNKHTITLLTHKNEVVNIKMYSSEFIAYNRVIKEEVDGKSKTMDDSWLKRGNKILAVGYRQDDMFRLKKYNNSVYQHTISLIDRVDEDGSLVVRNLRYGQQEKKNDYKKY